MGSTVTSACVLGITLMLTAHTYALLSTKCPNWSPGDPIVSLAHETHCTKYYVCNNGERYLKECPFSDSKGNRLYFNPALQGCDWPYNVNCKLPYPRALVMAKVNIPTECPKVDPVNHTIQLAHETDCTKFYKCSGGKKFLMDCPIFDNKGNRLYFNATLQLCDWPSNVDCKMPLPETLSMAKVEIPTECPKVDPANYTIQLAHETDCTKFYKCSGGKKFLMDCPIFDNKGNRLYFNATLQVCDWPSNVDCKLPTPKALFMAKVEIPTKCPNVDPVDHTIQLAHEVYCTKFYKCSGGKKFLMDCPDYDKKGNKLHFNPALQQCDWPSNVKCKLPLPQALVMAKVAIPTKCPNVDPVDHTIQLAHEVYCTKFYKCSGGQKFLMDCPDYDKKGNKLHFNPALQQCDWPSNVNCKLPLP